MTIHFSLQVKSAEAKAEVKYSVLIEIELHRCQIDAKEQNYIAVAYKTDKFP